MIAHLERVPAGYDRYHVRIFDVRAPTGYAKILVKKKKDYQGSLVITLKPDHAWVELATGAFDRQIYRQLRDYLFEEEKVQEIRWEGNGRIQSPKRRK